jgi:selenocysteine lyase/cysteine desulfurase
VDALEASTRERRADDVPGEPRAGLVRERVVHAAENAGGPRFRAGIRVTRERVAVRHTADHGIHWKRRVIAPEEPVATVRFQHPLNGQKLAAALYEKDRLAFQGGGNSLRVSPHFFNTHEEIDRTVAAIRRYTSGGLGTAA